MDFLIHWPPGPVVATVQCQGLPLKELPASLIGIEEAYRNFVYVSRAADHLHAPVY